MIDGFSNVLLTTALMCLCLKIILKVLPAADYRSMAYWSSTDYGHFASESSPYDLRNAKPRWQQLAEIAQGYSSSSDPLSTATAPTTNQNFEQMERRNRNSRNGGDAFWNRRPRAHDGNVASLGASRSRSQSRRSRTRTTITEEFAPRRRSESPQTHGCLSTFWRSVLSIYLLALLNNVLVWYDESGISDARTIRRSSTEEVWTSHDESVVERVGHQICKIPVVPRVLNCSQPSGSEVPSDQSVHHYLRGIVSALSENPDTVDAILDKTEDIKKELVALQKLELDNISPIRPAESIQIESDIRAEPLCTDRLLNLTSILEVDLVDWDSDKDELLNTMQAQLTSLNLEHQDMARERFNFAIARNLEEIATSLEHMQSSNLAALNKTLGLLLDDIPVFIQCLEASEIADVHNTSSTPTDRPSILKRLILWSLPFTTSLSNTADPSLTPDQRKKIIHDHTLAISPLLHAIQASNAKAYSAATTAQTMMMVRTSWIGSIIEVFWRGQRESFDKDLLAGLKEMRSLVPMIMEQRRGGKAERKYTRVMARAKKAVKEIKAKANNEPRLKTRRVQSSYQVWERRGGVMQEVVSEHHEHDMDEKALKAHDEAMEEHEKRMEEHDKQMEEHDRQMKEHNKAIREERKVRAVRRNFARVQEFFD